MSISDELEKLGKLKAEGVMSEEEFAQAKARLLEGSMDTSGAHADREIQTSNGSTDVNQWCMFIHLSQLIPFAGLIIPIVLWQMKKDESPIIDRHGKMVTNWVISALIYGSILMVLTIIVIGALLMPVLGIAGVVFAIIGGIKANNGEFWQYPLSLKLIK
ncbi:MAG: putative Tic20 family protein [Verrucomicrobiales bacterium]|jgi:uncharacterized Tic20 family protein